MRAVLSFVSPFGGELLLFEELLLEKSKLSLLENHVSFGFLLGKARFGFTQSCLVACHEAGSKDMCL